jgi:membrane-associated HD superfamily phosphohydrolase
LPARLRQSFWRAVRRVLGADVLWSGALIAVVVLVLGVQRCGPEYESYEVGERAGNDIKAVDDFEFVDVGRTDEERQKAVDKVLEIYDHDTERGIRRARQLSNLFEQGRAALAPAVLRPEGAEEAVALEIGERVAEPALAALVRQGFDAEVEREMSGAPAGADDYAATRPGGAHRRSGRIRRLPGSRGGPAGSAA